MRPEPCIDAAPSSLRPPAALAEALLPRGHSDRDSGTGYASASLRPRGRHRSSDEVPTQEAPTWWRPTRQIAETLDYHLSHYWRTTTRASHLKVTIGLRGLWPHVAAMYATCNFAENLTDLAKHWHSAHHALKFWGEWVVLEPLAVAVLLFLALRLPRDSLWADFAFLGAIFADLLMGSKLSNVLRSYEAPEYHVTGVLLWFYTIVSMFVFAGFHMISVLSFWFATTILIVLFYEHCCGVGTLVVLGSGLGICLIASLIEYRITNLCEVMEAQRHAESILLEHATAGSCVVNSKSGLLEEISPNLLRVLGGNARTGHTYLLDYVCPEDQSRAQTLMNDAGAGLLGATLVTLRLNTGPPRQVGGVFSAGRRLQDARLIAYSTSRFSIKVCLQLLGEARPPPLDALSERPGGLRSAVAAGSPPPTPSVQQPFTEAIGVPAAAAESAQLTPPGSQADSGSHCTAPLRVAGWPTSLLAGALAQRLGGTHSHSPGVPHPGAGGPGSHAASQSTAPLPWADPGMPRSPMSIAFSNSHAPRFPSPPSMQMHWQVTASSSSCPPPQTAIHLVSAQVAAAAASPRQVDAAGMLGQAQRGNLAHALSDTVHLRKVLIDILADKSDALDKTYPRPTGANTRVSSSVIVEAKTAQAFVRAQQTEERRKGAVRYWLSRLGNVFVSSTSSSQIPPRAYSGGRERLNPSLLLQRWRDVRMAYLAFGRWLPREQLPTVVVHYESQRRAFWDLSLQQQGPGVPRQLLVDHVDPGGQAAQAGVRGGDALLEVQSRAGALPLRMREQTCSIFDVQALDPVTVRFKLCRPQERADVSSAAAAVRWLPDRALLAVAEFLGRPEGWPEPSGATGARALASVVAAALIADAAAVAF
eukprot:TRINITY_DN81111_c0_g1_i1.p1 TRINITY_DN81111_c0_g1~~TRINITY_DN81111_c0_g1_i1.p1  ORF type:complete len:873 (+),score=80.97 TRINITY_DN81111_c0_g1_i1:87-2705(+)